MREQLKQNLPKQELEDKKVKKEFSPDYLEKEFNVDNVDVVLNATRDIIKQWRDKEKSIQKNNKDENPESTIKILDRARKLANLFFNFEQFNHPDFKDENKKRRIVDVLKDCFIYVDDKKVRDVVKDVLKKLEEVE
ncbi:hypothetical protein KKC56_01750 [Patescibacteria group bacterium]|nr:hypothetical protein [Patescibacteria group bacterium]